jgi:hypothetical protein
MFIFFFYYVKDAIDLLQGHYIVSVGRDSAPSSQKGGIEAIAVSTIIYDKKNYWFCVINFVFKTSS